MSISRRNRTRTATGNKTADKEYAFDVISFVTGFDAGAGALTRMDVRGEKGIALKDEWIASKGFLTACS